jgi:hypothetical protein
MAALTHHSQIEAIRNLLQDAEHNAFCFFLVDAAQHPAIWTSLNSQANHLVWLSLMAHTGNDDAIRVGPVLIHVEPEQLDVAFRIVERAQGSHYLSWITSTLPHADLRDHLAGLLDIETEDGSSWVMRYFDTRVLPVWHAALTAEQRGHVFGPLIHWGYFNRAGESCVLHGEQRAEAPMPKMLKLTQDQENVLLDAAYPDAVIQQLESAGNEDLMALPDGERYPFIARQIGKAQERYGIKSAPDILLFCTLALAGGEGFDALMPMARILRSVSTANISLHEACLQQSSTTTSECAAHAAPENTAQEQ